MTHNHPVMYEFKDKVLLTVVWVRKSHANLMQRRRGLFSIITFESYRGTEKFSKQTVTVGRKSAVDCLQYQ